MSRASSSVILILGWLLCAAGCGSSGPFDYVKVSGNVSFEDGEPLTVGRVIFESQAASVGNAHPRAGVGDLSDSGDFESVTSYKPGDGLVPGEHKVAIMYAVDKNGKSLVPKELASIGTTTLIVNTDDSPFEIVIPRP